MYNYKLKKVISILLIAVFSAGQILPIQPRTAYAQGMPNLPIPGTMVMPSQSYTPAIIGGMTIYPDNPLKFDFIIDTGDDNLQGEELRQEAQKMINYFFATLTVPDDEMWVNLSPYEDDRIIPQGLGNTEMGRDMLAQDYMLKQLTASLMYPEEEIGSEFWQRIYEQANARLGTTDIPANTFNKVWIVPEQAEVYVHEHNVFVSKSYLKVYLEEDYLALEQNRNSTKHGLGDMTLNDIEIMSQEAKEVIREVIIPEIEHEVNEGKNFANLRQIYHSMILASWYKKNLKESILGKVYMDTNKVDGIELDDKQIKQKIYNQYLEAFKKGVYDYIREDYDPATKQMIPRKYFSGGLKGAADQTRRAEVFPGTAVLKDRRERRQAQGIHPYRFGVDASIPGQMNRKGLFGARDSRGFDGEENDFYTLPIQTAFIDGYFAATKLDGSGKFVQSNFELDTDIFIDSLRQRKAGTIKFSTSISETEQNVYLAPNQINVLNTAIGELLDEGSIQQEHIENLTIIFIPGKPAHYSLGRDQIFLDSNLLTPKDKDELKMIIRHEITERVEIRKELAILGLLQELDDTAKEPDLRSERLKRRIKMLSRIVHVDLMKQEGREQYVSSYLTKQALKDSEGINVDDLIANGAEQKSISHQYDVLYLTPDQIKDVPEGTLLYAFSKKKFWMPGMNIPKEIANLIAPEHFESKPTVVGYLIEPPSDIPMPVGERLGGLSEYQSRRVSAAAGEELLQSIFQPYGSQLVDLSETDRVEDDDFFNISDIPGLNEALRTAYLNFKENKMEMVQWNLRSVRMFALSEQVGLITPENRRKLMSLLAMFFSSNDATQEMLEEIKLTMVPFAVRWFDKNGALKRLFRYKRKKNRTVQEVMDDVQDKILYEVLGKGPVKYIDDLDSLRTHFSWDGATLTLSPDALESLVASLLMLLMAESLPMDNGNKMLAIQIIEKIYKDLESGSRLVQIYGRDQARGVRELIVVITRAIGFQQFDSVVNQIETLGRNVLSRGLNQNIMDIELQKVVAYAARLESKSVNQQLLVLAEHVQNGDLIERALEINNLARIIFAAGEYSVDALKLYESLIRKGVIRDVDQIAGLIVDIIDGTGGYEAMRTQAPRFALETLAAFVDNDLVDDENLDIVREIMMYIPRFDVEELGSGEVYNNLKLLAIDGRLTKQRLRELHQNLEENLTVLSQRADFDEQVRKDRRTIFFFRLRENIFKELKKRFESPEQPVNRWAELGTFLPAGWGGSAAFKAYGITDQVKEIANEVAEIIRLAELKGFSLVDIQNRVEAGLQHNINGNSIEGFYDTENAIDAFVFEHAQLLDTVAYYAIGDYSKESLELEYLQKPPPDQKFALEVFSLGLNVRSTMGKSRYVERPEIKPAQIESAPRDILKEHIWGLETPAGGFQWEDPIVLQNNGVDYVIGKIDGKLMVVSRLNELSILEPIKPRSEEFGQVFNQLRQMLVDDPEVLTKANRLGLLGEDVIDVINEVSDDLYEAQKRAGEEMIIDILIGTVNELIPDKAREFGFTEDNKEQLISELSEITFSDYRKAILKINRLSEQPSNLSFFDFLRQTIESQLSDFIEGRKIAIQFTPHIKELEFTREGFIERINFDIPLMSFRDAFRSIVMRDIHDLWISHAQENRLLHVYNETALYQQVNGMAENVFRQASDMTQGREKVEPILRQWVNNFVPGLFAEGVHVEEVGNRLESAIYDFGLNVNADGSGDDASSGGLQADQFIDDLFEEDEESFRIINLVAIIVSALAMVAALASIPYIVEFLGVIANVFKDFAAGSIDSQMLAVLGVVQPSENIDAKLSEGEVEEGTHGGIDFNPAAMDLQEKGQSIEFELDNSFLQNIQPESVDTVIPVIIHMTPITNFAPLLGLVDEPKEQQLSKT